MRKSAASWENSALRELQQLTPNTPLREFSWSAEEHLNWLTNTSKWGKKYLISNKWVIQTQNNVYDVPSREKNTRERAVPISLTPTYFAAICFCSVPAPRGSICYGFMSILKKLFYHLFCGSAEHKRPIRLCTCFPHVCILLPLRITQLKSSSIPAFFRVYLLQPESLKQPANFSRLSRGIKATKQWFKLTGMAWTVLHLGGEIKTPKNVLYRAEHSATSQDPCRQTAR